MGNNKEFSLGFGGYLFTQCAMLFLHYGLKYTMPWWATWFPTVAGVVFFVIAILSILIIAILEVLIK